MIASALSVTVSTAPDAAGGGVDGVVARIEVLGCPVDALDMPQTVQRCLELVARNARAQHIVLNAAKLAEAHRNARMRSIIESCELVSADGQAIVWAAQALGTPLPERVAGIDLMHELMSAAAQRGLSVYVLGAREEVLAAALENLRQRYPGLRVAGSRHGYFDDSEVAAVTAGIRAAAPDMLFVAMSSPRKEYFLADNKEALGVPFAMGVGGAIDVAAGLTRRAPRWVQSAGLEWFYRLAQEPRRMWRRYLDQNVFVVRALVRELWARRAGPGS
jgi:N-acetylglucosaminyldiphosphoundecaprenol N-acetyl-beta-D-mannosaminyltransferase